MKRTNNLFTLHNRSFLDSVCLGNEDAWTVDVVSLIGSGLVLWSHVLETFALLSNR